MHKCFKWCGIKCSPPPPTLAKAEDNTPQSSLFAFSPSGPRRSQWALLQDCDTTNDYFYIVNMQNYPGTKLCLSGIISSSTAPIQVSGWGRRGQRKCCWGRGGQRKCGWGRGGQRKCGWGREGQRKCCWLLGNVECKGHQFKEAAPCMRSVGERAAR